MRNVKQINIDNCTYCFDLSLLKIDKMSYKTLIFITWDKPQRNVLINSVNPLYVIIGEADGCIEENNGNRYLIFASTGRKKELLGRHKILWDEINSLIKTVNDDRECEFGKGFINIKFNSDDNLNLIKH